MYYIKNLCAQAPFIFDFIRSFWRKSFFLILFIVAVEVFPAITWLCYSMGENVLSEAQDPEVVVYLDKDVSLSQSERVVWQINQMPNMVKATYVPPQQGLKDFEKKYEVSVSHLMKDNPLPGVVIVTPSEYVNVSKSEQISVPM